MSNPCVTRGTSFVDDSESLGSLYAVESKRPPVAAVSMMISQFLGFSAVEAMRHPWQKFR